jgi:hypothetical protein
MTTTAIVEDLEKVKEGSAFLDMRVEGHATEQLTLKRGKETLRHGVVKAVPERAHGRADAYGARPVLERLGSVLAATVGVVKVGVMHRAGCWTAMLQRHLKGGEDELGAQMGPIDYPTTRRLQASSPTARKRKPWRVGMYVRSATQRALGRAATNARLIRSGARGRAASRRVLTQRRRRHPAPPPAA